MTREIKKTIKKNGCIIYTLYIDNKIIAQCSNINKLINLKK